MSTDNLTMGELDIHLVDHRIVKRGVYLRVTEQALHLFDRHSLVYGHRGHRAAELVWMHLADPAFLPELTQAKPNGAGCEAQIGARQCHEECRVIVHPTIEILLKVNLGAGVEINLSLLVALAEHHALPFLEINVRAVEAHQLANTHPSRDKKVDEGDITHMGTGVAEALQLLVGEDLAHGRLRAYLMNPSHRILDNDILILQPREKRGKDAPEIIDGHLARVTVALIVG